MVSIVKILDSTPPLTIGARQTLGELLLLWQRFPVGLVGVLDQSGILEGVLGKDIPFSQCEEITLSTPVKKIMSMEFSRVTPDTPLEYAWDLPGQAVAVFGGAEELVGLFTKSDLAIHLLNHTKTINQEMDAVLNAAQTGIIAVNKEGIITTFNPAAERITRRTREEAVPRC